MRPHTTQHARKGSVVLVVMWAVGVAALVLSAIQLLGYRQSMLGRERLGRVQARWAARGGVDYTIAVMASHTETPVPEDAKAMIREMAYVSYSRFEVAGRFIARYDIQYHTEGQDWEGPMDEHSKININGAANDPRLLAAFPDMTPDVVDAIRDWVDADDEVRTLGAERDYYQYLTPPYEPRNGAFRSLGELELVAGIWPEHLRGEDWNLNNRLDGAEDDGDRTWPPDEPDEELDAAWSGLLTAHSVRGGPALSGLERLWLRTATAEQLQLRLGVNEELAQALVTFGNDRNNRLAQLLTASLLQPETEGDGGQPGLTSGNSRQQGAAPAGGQSSGSMPLLTPDQLRAVFAETTMDDPKVRMPGKLNINTVSEDLLRRILVGQEHLADEIIFLRNRHNGITSMVDLGLEIPALRDDTGTLEYLAQIMDTYSTVYTITSRGRAAGGIEAEIIAVVDRSTVPVKILQYREQ